MARPKAELKPKTIKYSASHQEMFDTFTQKWGFISESEVARQALVFFYQKYEPPYRKPTANQQEKMKLMEEQRRLETMSDEEWVAEVVRGRILPSEDGRKWLVMHWWGNSLHALDMATARRVLTEEMVDAIPNHLSILTARDLDQRIRESRGFLRSTFKIIVPDEGEES